MSGTNKARRAASIIDVARLAGVSHQTVSRVLNNPETVRPKTLETVQKAIVQTRYHRNENARALKSSVSNCLGILTPDSKQFGPNELLWAVEKAASEQGFVIKTALLSGRSESQVRRAVGKLLEFDVAAIIIIATETWVEPAVRMTVSLPIVSLGCPSSEDEGISTVDIDQKRGVKMLIDHLAESGTKRIDHVSGPRGWYSSDARLEAWLNAEAEHDLASGRLYRGDWSEASGYAMGLRIVKDLPDAVFASNDQMAMGVIRALYEHGVRVPRDLFVAGFDNSPLCAYTIPSLTTLSQDFTLTGTQAVSCAVSMIGGHKPSRALIVPDLIVRESTTYEE